MTDTLYISSRIFNAADENKTDAHFIDGGVLVAGEDGKISRIFDSREAVNSWMYKNDAAFVSSFYNFFVVFKNYQ
jgi:hypothetical protein